MFDQQDYCIRVAGEQLAHFFRHIRSSVSENTALPVRSRVQFLCIGTDRSIGDSLGPLTGTLLLEAGFTSVIGHLQEPCDAATLLQQIKKLRTDCPTIAVDAGLGRDASIGLFQASNRPMEPGKSMELTLPKVGDYSLAGIVNTLGPLAPVRQLQLTPLARIYKMASEIRAAAEEVWRNES